jgi:restriction system protein
MARRNRSIVEDLAILPWWINVILAFVVYLSCKYWIPSITFQNPFIKALATAMPSFAPVVAVLFIFLAAVSASNALRKDNLLDRQRDIGTLRTISWQEFEELVGEAYRRKGYAITESGGGGADGGIDLILRKGGENLLVQCKHWKMDKVGVKVVRELYGVVTAERATGGVVISSGSFTQEAKDFARGKPLKLLDGSELLRFIEDVQKTPMPISNRPNNPFCPLCGAQMVLRTAKRGPNAGGNFWGCSTFPKCRGTKAYSA